MSRFAYFFWPCPNTTYILDLRSSLATLQVIPFSLSTTSSFYIPSKGHYAAMSFFVDVCRLLSMTASTPSLPHSRSHFQKPLSEIVWALTGSLHHRNLIPILLFLQPLRPPGPVIYYFFSVFEVNNQRRRLNHLMLDSLEPSRDLRCKLFYRRHFLQIMLGLWRALIFFIYRLSGSFIKRLPPAAIWMQWALRWAPCIRETLGELLRELLVALQVLARLLSIKW
jgi:hypothetical protein